MGLLKNLWNLNRLDARVSELEEEMDLLRERVRRSRARHALQEARARAAEERELQEAAELLAASGGAQEGPETPPPPAGNLRMLDVIRRRRS